MTEPRQQPAWRPFARRAFRCRCRRPVFFGNTRCLGCGTELGYAPEAVQVLPLLPARSAGVFRSARGRPPQHYRRCANFDSPALCDWLVAVDARGQPDNPLCRACRLNRGIPDLTVEENRRWWALLEAAKRRMVSSLIALGLPVRSRVSEDPTAGLAFDFLRAAPGEPPVVTGHADGIVTIDVEEADDARREQRRLTLNEPYRTLLGHLRHEIGHYYWQRLIGGSERLEAFRACFGDERADYTEALRQHHSVGPPPDWQLRHVSAYASSHPWEDWAETWAHYLHMVDTLDTAASYDVRADAAELRFEPFAPDVLGDAAAADGPGFLAFVDRWVRLAAVLNELSRSMGQPEFYPFVLAAATVRKLYFVHQVVERCRTGGGIVGGSRTGTGLSTG